MELSQQLLIRGALLTTQLRGRGVASCCGLWVLHRVTLRGLTQQSLVSLAQLPAPLNPATRLPPAHSQHLHPHPPFFGPAGL